jgi:hypothetical protein
MLRNSTIPRGTITTLWVLAITAVAAAPAPVAAADKAPLLIGLTTELLTNRLSPTGKPGYLLQFRLKNLATGKIYTRSKESSREVFRLDVTPGIYCLYSVQVYINQELRLCSEPWVRVDPDRINNAGRWRIGTSFQPPAARVLRALDDADGVAADARRYFPGLFRERRLRAEMKSGSK